MSDLTSKSCIPCRAGAAPATASEITVWLAQLPAWQIVTVDAVQHLSRSFTFNDFQQALTFTNRVGALAEAEQHHPELVTAWGKVRVDWWTHKIKGLHRNDFIMAAKTDRLYAGA